MLEIHTRLTKDPSGWGGPKKWEKQGVVGSPGTNQVPESNSKFKSRLLGHYEDLFAMAERENIFYLTVSPSD